MKKINLLLSGLLCLWLNAAYAQTQVTVFYPNKAPVTLENVPTLQSLIVNNPALPNPIWWPGAAIAERDATRAQQLQQQQVLARLAQLSSVLRRKGDLLLAATVDQVRLQIADLRIIGRQFVPLDPDWLRLRPDLDHRLVGEYQLYLAPEPSGVTILGAVAPHGKRDFLAGKDVSEYFTGLQRLNGAERSVAWIITAQGEAYAVPIAYWNRRHNEIAPGGLLFLGFAACALPEDFNSINEQIISLLTHRIPD